MYHAFIVHWIDGEYASFKELFFYNVKNHYKGFLRYVDLSKMHFLKRASDCIMPDDRRLKVLIPYH